ncbi:MAG: cellulose synthase operon protein YhjQ/BcsQ, partial [Limisphaerales bacterium]
NDTQKAYTEQLQKIRQEIFNTEAEIAERATMVKQVQRRGAGQGSAIPTGTIVQYRHIHKLLEEFYSREQEMLIKLAPGNPTLDNIRSEIVQAEEMKLELEKKHPGLASKESPVLATTNRRKPFDTQGESARVVALQSKIDALNEQLERVRNEAASVSELEPLITELERQKELQESQYRYFSANLEQARIDEALRAGRVSNISVVQKPSFGKQYIGKLHTVVLALALGGLISGIVLAYFLEFYLNQSVKRAVDVETKLGLPLFFSMPWLKWQGQSRLPWFNKTPPLLPDGRNKHGAGDSSKVSVPWAEDHPLRPSLEALRDRLVFDFEIKQLRHKPKLVAVTSTRENAGVSTIAAGLAATLSETGDGNVLLVDMNSEQNVPQLFQRGHLSCGLDQVLNGDAREEAMVQDNLYLACNSSGENGENKARPPAKRFASLVPRLKASDFDFIIFDMPPVSQTSATPHLTRHMDFVLMVVEAEKNNSETVRRASTLVTDSDSKLGIVLNKTRSYVPKRLIHDI